MKKKNILIVKLIFIFFLIMGSFSSSFALISERDKQLNDNIRQFIPIYCNIKRIPWESWGRKYEFVIQLLDSEPLTPKPVSEINGSFMGYKNKATKIKVICNKFDPIYSRLISTDVIGVFDIHEFSKIIPYAIQDHQSELFEVFLTIERNRRDIEVVDSGKFMHFFKTYAPARILNVSFAVKNYKKS